MSYRRTKKEKQRVEARRAVEPVRWSPETTSSAVNVPSLRAKSAAAGSEHLASIYWRKDLVLSAGVSAVLIAGLVLLTLWQ